MTDQTDFIGLYRELGLEPDCSVDAFRLAYRRRVADLHPDRAGASGEDGLKTLNLRYAAALEFHRHYGRLPGATPLPSPLRRPFAPAPAQAETLDDAQGDEAPARGPSRWVVYGMLVLALLLAWWWSQTDAEPVAIDPVAVADIERKAAGPAATRLLPGMSPAEVLALHGEPVGTDSDHTQWLYGPSWIRFRCARVVDWYSSPLKPLKAAGTKPGSLELAQLPADDGRPCPPMPQPRTRPWPTSP